MLKVFKQNEMRRKAATTLKVLIIYPMTVDEKSVEIIFKWITRARKVVIIV